MYLFRNSVVLIQRTANIVVSLNHFLTESVWLLTKQCPPPRLCFQRIYVHMSCTITPSGTVYELANAPTSSNPTHNTAFTLWRLNVWRLCQPEVILRYSLIVLRTASVSEKKSWKIKLHLFRFSFHLRFMMDVFLMSSSDWFQILCHLQPDILLTS